MPRPCALVAGASGVVGRAVARTLAESGEWDVVPLSRSPAAVTGARAIAVDLSSPADTRDRLSALTGVTHLIYCARATHTMARRESVDDNVDIQAWNADRIPMANETEFGYGPSSLRAERWRSGSCGKGIAVQEGARVYRSAGLVIQRSRVLENCCFWAFTRSYLFRHHRIAMVT